MLHTLSFTLLALAGAAAAQEGLTPCILGCIAPAAIANGCVTLYVPLLFPLRILAIEWEC
jgi:hypothetical protein